MGIFVKGYINFLETLPDPLGHLVQAVIDVNVDVNFFNVNLSV
jgi:hypothetical protein